MSRKAIQTEGIAEAKGIQEMNNALAGSGGEAIVKLRIATLVILGRIIDGKKFCWQGPYNEHMGS